MKHRSARVTDIYPKCKIKTHAREQNIIKVRYPTRLDALIALSKLDAKRVGRQETRIYRCPQCKGFHITSKRRNKD